MTGNINRLVSRDNSEIEKNRMRVALHDALHRLETDENIGIICAVSRGNEMDISISNVCLNAICSMIVQFYKDCPALKELVDFATKDNGGSNARH